MVLISFIINIMGEEMGVVQADITLKNIRDKIMTKEGYINEPEIRQTAVKVVVDTGAMTLIINEQLRQQLGLGAVGARQATLADNTRKTVKIAEAVEVHWKNRSMICQPWVVDEGRTLLGLIPLENMDLMVDPCNHVLVGVHGDKEEYLLL